MENLSGLLGAMLEGLKDLNKKVVTLEEATAQNTQKVADLRGSDSHSVGEAAQVEVLREAVTHVEQKLESVTRLVTELTSKDAKIAFLEAELNRLQLQVREMQVNHSMGDTFATEAAVESAAPREGGRAAAGAATAAVSDRMGDQKMADQVFSPRSEGRREASHKKRQTKEPKLVVKKDKDQILEMSSNRDTRRLPGSDKRIIDTQKTIDAYNFEAEPRVEEIALVRASSLPPIVDITPEEPKGTADVESEPSKVQWQSGEHRVSAKTDDSGHSAAVAAAEDQNVSKSEPAPAYSLEKQSTDNLPVTVAVAVASTSMEAVVDAVKSGSIQEAQTVNANAADKEVKIEEIELSSEKAASSPADPPSDPPVDPSPPTSKVGGLFSRVKQILGFARVVKKAKRDKDADVAKTVAQGAIKIAAVAAGTQGKPAPLPQIQKETPTTENPSKEIGSGAKVTIEQEKAEESGEDSDEEGESSYESDSEEDDDEEEDDDDEEEEEGDSEADAGQSVPPTTRVPANRSVAIAAASPKPSLQRPPKKLVKKSKSRARALGSALLNKLSASSANASQSEREGTGTFARLRASVLEITQQKSSSSRNRGSTNSQQQQQQRAASSLIEQRPPQQTGSGRGSGSILSLRPRGKSAFGAFFNSESDGVSRRQQSSIRKSAREQSGKNTNF